jgi:lipoprotein-anchoring transpeptidase ErfK/SrfK
MMDAEPQQRERPTMHLNRPTSRRTVVAAAAVGVLVVGAGIVVAATRTPGTAAEQHVATRHAPLPAATVRLGHVKHGVLPYRRHFAVSVSNGTLRSVELAPVGGAAVAGSFDPNRSQWRSANSFAPLTRMTARVSYVGVDRHVTTRTMSLRTTDSKHHVDALLSPGAGDTVGIGSPVSVSFSSPIPTSMQAEVERRLSVTTSPAVVGAWHWMSDTEVHWRPPAYWKAGTKVTIGSDLQGIDFGHGLWGAMGAHRTSFKVGDAHVSEADVGAHVMRVYSNGTLIHTFPISAGRDQYPTMGGVHIAIEKSPVVHMDSATVGIEPGNPDYYNETVYWDVRITDGGAFVHAAPWSVSDQGNTNVSHGCINLSTANAEWFYKWALRGDIVDVYDVTRPPSSTDPGTADWNMTWKKWVAGDAAPTAAAKALHPRLPHQTEPGFAPVKHHHKSSKSGKNSKAGAAKKHGATA